MSEEQSSRLKDSPRKGTHLQVTRKLCRSGDDLIDADEYASEYFNFQDCRAQGRRIRGTMHANGDFERT